LIPTPSPFRANVNPVPALNEVAPAALEQARHQLVTAACAPFDLPALRDALTKAKQEANKPLTASR
jgi:hypothetical protein